MDSPVSLQEAISLVAMAWVVVPQCRTLIEKTNLLLRTNRLIEYKIPSVLTNQYKHITVLIPQVIENKNRHRIKQKNKIIEKKTTTNNKH